MTKHLDGDVCLDFLQGLLDAGEQQELFEHAACCAECEQLLRAMASANERARAAARDLAPAARRVVPIASHRGRRRAWAFAAAIVFAAGGILYFLPREAQRAPEPGALLRWMQVPGEAIASRGAAPFRGDVALERGLSAYARRDAAEAVRWLESSRPGGDVEPVRRIFLGSALAWSGDHARAVAVLDSVAFEKLPEPWKGEALWTLHAALRGAGREARADSLLGVLARSPGVAGERARAMQRGAR